MTVLLDVWITGFILIENLTDDKRELLFPNWKILCIYFCEFFIFFCITITVMFLICLQLMVLNTEQMTIYFNKLVSYIICLYLNNVHLYFYLEY